MNSPKEHPAIRDLRGASEREEERSSVRERRRQLDSLRRVLDCDLSEKDREAFASMLRQMTTEREMLPGEIRMLRPGKPDEARYERWVLSPKQWVYLHSVLEREEGKEPTRLTAGDIPRGREVPVPEVLRVLPKKPPGRE